jgi:hypothetical protein
MNDQDYIKLQKMFRSFVIHAKVIHKRSKDSYYKSSSTVASLDKCLPYIDAFRVFSSGYANAVLSLQNDLRRILPKKSNSSYQSSITRLNEMIALSYKIKNESTRVNKPDCKQTAE